MTYKEPLISKPPHKSWAKAGLQLGCCWGWLRVVLGRYLGIPVTCGGLAGTFAPPPSLAFMHPAAQERPSAACAGGSLGH